MALNPFKFIKGIFVQNEVDRTKEVGLEVSNSASSGTSTTVVAKQTLSRTLDLPNTSGELVEKDFAQTLTNKTIDGDNNTLQDIGLSSLKTVLADADKFIVRDVSGQVISNKAVPVGVVVGNSDTQTLTNKTIDADLNTISNIENADIKIGAAIDAAKIHDGSVSNTEFGYLNGVTSSIQTQIDAKAEIAGATDNRLVKTDGATDIQQTGITVDDSNNVTGVNNLTVDGNLTVNGTTTTLNTAILDVEDQNITVNINGNDTTAEGSGLTVNRAGTDGSLVYEDALPSKWKAGALGSEIQLANVSSTQSFTNKNLKSNTNLLTGARSDNFQRETGAAQVLTIPDVSAADTFVTQAHQQVLTNKDFDGGVASNNRRLTVPSNTLSNLLALTRKEGTLVYATDTDKFYLDDGSTLKEVGSGAGEVNFIPNGDAEANTNGWATYADVAGTRPVDGTGGTAAVTFTRTTTTPLSGQASFLFTKDAVNRQGQGASADFTIDLANRAKVLKISFDYLVASGTFVAGSNATDGDLIVYLYDVTNARLIEPSSIKLFSNNSTISDNYEATFQTSPDSSSYRLIFHCASTSAAAYTLKIDNVKVSPSSYVYGSPISDWSSFNPTWVSTGTQPSLGNGTLIGRFRRVGDNAQIQIRLTTGSTTTYGTGGYAFGFASVGSIDASKYISGSFATKNRGNFFDSSGGAIYDCAPFTDTPSSAMALRAWNASGTFSQHTDVGPTVPVAWATGDQAYLDFEVPISGWSSSVQMSDSTDTRIVAFSANKSATQVIAHNTDTEIVFQNVLFNTHGSAYNNTRYTIPVSGFYRISTQFNFSTGTGGATSIFSSVGLNGLNTRRIGTQTYGSGQAGGNGSTILQLVAGDQVSIFVTQQTGVSQTLEAIGNFSVERISGPSAIAANELIAVAAGNSSGQSIPNGVLTTLTNFTKQFDTHNAFNSVTGVFTVPASGLYEALNSVAFSSPHTANTGAVSVRIIQAGSGSVVSNNYTSFWPDTATGCQALTSHVFRCAAGDTLTFSILQTNGATRSLAIDSGTNRISVKRIGN
jgi:hypothetical protein